MELFEQKNFQVSFSPQAIAIKPFKKLWERDKSEEKTLATQELAFVYFYADYKSDYADILNDEDRAEEIIDTVMPEGWSPDEVVWAAVEFYRDRNNTVTSRLLEDAKRAVEKLRLYFRDVDLLETDDRGKPLHDANKLVTTLGNLGKVIEGLKDLEDQVKKEKEKRGSLRAGREKGMFEDIEDND